MKFVLNCRYKTGLWGFVAVADHQEGILFVNPDVPQKDVDGFLEVIQFPHYWVRDYEDGMGKFMDYVYEQYGYGVCAMLSDAQKQNLKEEEKRRAKKAAEAIIPLIERELESETPVVKYDEYLAHEIWEHGFELKRSTPGNMANYGNVYEFYFGYLMGAGMLSSSMA